MDDTTVPASHSPAPLPSTSPSSSSSTTTIQDFRVLAKLGLGAYGSVYQVVRKADNHTYAIKRVNLDGLDRRDLAMALNEIRLLASFRHPRIVRCYESFLDGPTHLCIVMEYCGFQDLARKIQRYRARGERVDERVVWVYLVQCLEALSALHALRVLHRDIKPANILLDEDGNAKLGDLNVSKCLDDETGEVQSVLGTLPYMAPEIWEGKPYGFAADLYSLGCTLFELTTLSQPFDGPTPLHLRRAVLKRQFQVRLDTDEVYSQDLRDVILLRLLHPDPTQRLTADTLMQLPEVASRLDLVRHKLPADLPDSLPHTPSTLLLHHLKSNGGSKEDGGKEGGKEEPGDGVATPGSSSLSLTLAELPSLLPSLLPGPSYPEPPSPPPPPSTPEGSSSAVSSSSSSNDSSINTSTGDATLLPSPLPPSLALPGLVVRQDSLTALLRSPFAPTPSTTISRTAAAEATATAAAGVAHIQSKHEQANDKLEEGAQKVLVHASSTSSSAYSSSSSSSNSGVTLPTAPSATTTTAETTAETRAVAAAAAATSSSSKAKHGNQQAKKKRPDSLSAASMLNMSASASALSSTNALLRSLSISQVLGDDNDTGANNVEGEGGREGPRGNLNSEGHVQWEALPTPNSFPLPLLSPCPASPPFEQVLVSGGGEGGKAGEGGGRGGMIEREEGEVQAGGFRR